MFEIKTGQVDKNARAMRETPVTKFAEKVVEEGIFEQKVEDGNLLWLAVPKKDEDESAQTTGQRGKKLVEALEVYDPRLKGKIKNRLIRENPKEPGEYRIVLTNPLVENSDEEE